MIVLSLAVSAALVAAFAAARLWRDRPPRVHAFSPLGLRDVLAAGVLWLAILNVVGRAFHVASARPEGADGLGVADVAALVVGHALFLAILIAYLRARYGASLSDVGFRRPRAGDVAFGILVYLASIPGWWLASAVSRAVAGELPVQRSVDLFRDSTALERSILSLAAVVTAPVAEEFLFRGIVFGALRGTVGLGPAVVFSSILFGLVHSDAAVLPLVWLGAVLAIVYHRTGSLWVATAVHAAHNAAMLLLISAVGSPPGAGPAPA